MNCKFRWLPLLPALSILAAPALRADESTAAASAHHSLWRVQGKSNVVYLLGAVHLLKPSHHPLAAPINAAFADSGIVVFETDLEEMESLESQMKLMSKGKLPEGETLNQVLSAEVYAAFDNCLTNAGLPSGALDTFRPSIAGISLVMLELQKMGVDPEYGVDRYFFQRARDGSKTVKPLETVDYQIDLLTGLTKEEGQMMMKSVLKEIDNTRKSYDEIIEAWQTGDAAKLETLLNDAMREAPGVYKRLVTDRTQQWLPKVEQFLADTRNTIVIVGAGHLVGKQGLVELLQAKGWKVTQL